MAVLRERPYVQFNFLVALGDGTTDGPQAGFQEVSGIGMEVTVRYALDPSRIASVARKLPQDVGKDLIEPVTDGVLYRTLAKFTVKEIFSDKRAELQQSVARELTGLVPLPSRTPLAATSR